MNVLENMEEKLLKRIDNLLERIDELNEQLKKQTETSNEENQLLREQVAYLTNKLFGKSSEKMVDPDGQLDLFSDDESFSLAETTEEKTEVEEIHYKRKKKIGHKAELIKDLPVRQVFLELPDEACTCDWCNTPMKKIGKNHVRDEIVFIPATMYKKEYYTYAYACPHCKKNDTDVIKRAEVPKAPIKNSLSSPTSLAQLHHQKTEMSLPYYRQEKEWANYGLKVSRKTLANWFILSSEKWLLPIWKRLKTKLLDEHYLHADETYYRVLDVDKTNTYYWLFQTAEAATHQIALYQHEKSRSGLIPKQFLERFTGFLHCDAYSGYQQVDGVKLVNCWAHLRRYFVDAKGVATKETKADQGIAFCQKLFEIEKRAKDVSSEERYEMRQKEAVPLLHGFWKWIESFTVLTGSKLGKAVNYAVNHKEGFMNFLLDGNCVISNNLAERSIRPTTIGRKNWLFSKSLRGAVANGLSYSIVQTAKLNGLSPTKYLTYLFEKLPNEPKIKNPEALDAYLPWSKEVQLNCK